MLRRQKGAGKPPPRHALPARAPRKDNTTLVLIILLILSSGFVVGTTATFNASTRNAGNTFTTAALSQPSAPAVPGSYMTGNSALVNWTAADTSAESPFNIGLGYRVLRAYAGGPTDTAGTSPGCTSGSLTYATLGYSSLVSYTDATIPTAAADQGKHYCFATESVWPCCPIDGKKPVITSLDAAQRVIQDIQTGYVVSSWQFTGTLTDGIPASGEQLVVNFNQSVDVANSVNTNETVCSLKASKLLVVGSNSTVKDTCVTTLTYEKQTFKIDTAPTSGSWTITFPSPVSCSANIAYSSSNATSQTNFRAALTTCLGASGWSVGTAGSCGACLYSLTYAGQWTGDMPLPTATPNFTPARTMTTVDNVTPAASISVGTLTNPGTWGGDAAGRWTISAVDWTNCTVPAVACRTATITLGGFANGGSKVPTMPTTGTWTIAPQSSRLSRSYSGGLGLCATDPVGSPGNGLCKPTAVSGW